MHKIVIPIWEFNPSGGMRVLACLANEWQKLGVEVTFVCSCYSEKPYFPVECPVIYVDEHGGITSRQGAVSSKGSLFDSGKYIMVRHSGLLKIMNALSDRFDVAIANSNLTAYSVAKSQVRNKFYYIQAYEGARYQDRKLRHLILNQLAIHSYRLNLVQIVNSSFFCNYHEIRSKYVIPPGIDLSIYYPKALYYDGTRPIIVGCIGRPILIKGCQEIGIAVNHLQEKGIPVDFRVAFHPIEYGNFTVVQPHGDKNLAEYYRSCDIIVATPRVELGGVHYPVIESMACGTPVISTGHFPATSENAYLVPVNSPLEIEKAILSIAENYDTAIKKAAVAREDVLQFEWSKVSRQMLDILVSESK